MASRREKAEQAKRAKVRKLKLELVEAMRDLLPEGSFAEREQAMLELTTEIENEIGKQELQELADSVGDKVEVQGKVYKRHQSGAVRYHSLAGGLLVVRDTYREEGVRNGPTIVPLEWMAGVAERATPALSRNIAHGYARHDMRTHREVLQEAHSCPPSRATLERIAKALAARAYEQVSEIETRAFTGENVPSEAAAISIGFDRVSVPMGEQLPAGETKPPPVRSKPYVRAVPTPIEVNWRMAFVGTVSVVDSQGEAITVTRYAATAEDDPRLLVERMRRQVEQILGQSPKLRVGIVQDGAPEMWTLMRQLLQPLKDKGTISQWHEAIDLPHLMGRRGEAFKVALGSSPAVVESWKLKLLESDGVIDTVETALKRQLPALIDEAADILQGHLTYIENNKDRMRYATVREAGLPIGSGVTESTAKNVVNMRAKRSGQRWSISGLRGVLNLRALLKSDRLGKFWEVLSRGYVSHVTPLPARA